MSEIEDFRLTLARYAKRQPSKAEAARKLGIARQDLYRYLASRTAPRRDRRERLVRLMEGSTGQQPPASPLIESSRLDVKSVTHLRDILLHLVRLLDLDAAGGVSK